MDNHARVRQFIGDFTHLIERHANDEPAIFDQGGKLLAALVSEDDWLPVAYSMPDADRYQQYLLYCDPLERFSVMSFVWGPGQKTPVHDHTVWGIIGVLRGMEICHEYEVTSGSAKAVASHELRRGEIDRVSPSVGDVHRVENAYADQISISIHVYGGNIGSVSRHLYDVASGRMTPFVSGYSAASMPNFWDRSAEVRAMLTV